jgi:STELLO glycosyltransferase-like protein
MFYTVITTIAEPTACVLGLVTRLEAVGGRLVVAGDSKGPARFEIGNTDFLSIEEQRSMPFKIAKLLPECHYTRKNLGYLYAISKGADCIYETDDDNAPLEHWKLRDELVRDIDEVLPQGSGEVEWLNIYRYFSDENIWPRGLPLDKITQTPPAFKNCNENRLAPIQQGLVNNSPDVDAIWRLSQDRLFDFDTRASIVLAPGLWCPFNTQSTWWWSQAYPLMYIPSFCSFRMCDIWKSFVAQRCLWELGYGVVFHSPEVYQDRNPHDLMKDFTDEIPGYTGNHKIAQVLTELKLKAGAGNQLDNLILCYEALIKAGFFPEKELELVLAWAEDLGKII